MINQDIFTGATIYRGTDGGLFLGDGVELAVFRRPFWVKILGNDGLYHSWQQMWPNPPGTLVIDEAGMTGLTTLNPVYDANGYVIPTGFNIQVWGAYFDQTGLDWVFVCSYFPPTPLPPPPPPCTDVEYDPQTKDQCDYPTLNRYVRTLVYLCGILQFPLPGWELVGQVGCCDCDTTGSGSGPPNCCCPANQLCVAWPYADDPAMVVGLTLTPTFSAFNAICQWQFFGKLGIGGGTNVTVTATWYGCEISSGGVGTLVIDVSCPGVGNWAVYIADIPIDSHGCWDMTQQRVAIWDGGATNCSAFLGAPPAPYVHVIEGPSPCRFDSGTSTGTGSACAQPASLCAYVPPGNYFGCNCANGAQVTLAYQGGYDYLGTLFLSGCSGDPSLFVYVSYRNDGTNWQIQIQLTGCNGDTGIQTFYGSSNGNCLAGLPQCVTVSSPNDCCGTGAGGTGSGGFIIVPFEPATAGCVPIGGTAQCINSVFNTGSTPPGLVPAWLILDAGAGVYCISFAPQPGGIAVWADPSQKTGLGRIAVFSPPGPGCQCQIGWQTYLVCPNPTPGGGDTFVVCVTEGPCIVSGSGSGTLYWCVHVTEQTGGGLSCSAGAVPTISATSTGGGACAPGNFNLNWDAGLQLWHGLDAKNREWFIGCSGTNWYVQAPGPWGGGRLNETSLPFTATFDGQAGGPCAGDTTTISFSGAGGVTGTGSGATDFYECFSEAELTGSISVGGAVTFAGGSGTVVSGPYETPVCDNQCQPTSGSGVPQTCCGWTASTVPPILFVTGGGFFVGFGSVQITFTGTNADGDLTWSGTSGSFVCGTISYTLTCNHLDGQFTLTGQVSDIGGAYAQFDAIAFPVCNPLLIKFHGNQKGTDPGGSIWRIGNVKEPCQIGPFTATVTLP